jgi:hypothetical protein
VYTGGGNGGTGEDGPFFLGIHGGKIDVEDELDITDSKL